MDRSKKRVESTDTERENEFQIFQKKKEKNRAQLRIRMRGRQCTKTYTTIQGRLQYEVFQHGPTQKKVEIHF